MLCSHLGRPKEGPDPQYSLAPVAAHLESLLGRPVKFVGALVGPVAEAAASTLAAGEALVLENTRFEAGETKNDPALAASLARLGSVYVNDAFGSAHRAHASTEGVAHHLPAVAGLLMEKELTYLGKVMEAAEHPFVAILGGAKISDKIGVVESLLRRADRLLVGGGMGNTFLAARGVAMGDSLVEAEALESARTILESAGDRLLLPTDVVAADAFAAEAARQTISLGEIPVRLASDGHRPGDGPSLHRGALLGPPGRLERTDGCVRDGAVRRRDVRRCAGVGGGVGHHDRRRWRLGGGGGASRPDRAHHPCFDRRRSDAGASRGQAASRGRGPDGSIDRLGIGRHSNPFPLRLPLIDPS